MKWSLVKFVDIRVCSFKPYTSNYESAGVSLCTCVYTLYTADSIYDLLFATAVLGSPQSNKLMNKFPLNHITVTGAFVVIFLCRFFPLLLLSHSFSFSLPLSLALRLSVFFHAIPTRNTDKELFLVFLKRKCQRNAIFESVGNLFSCIFSKKWVENANAKLSQNCLLYMHALSSSSLGACKYLCETFLLFSSCKLNAKAKECFKSAPSRDPSALSNSHPNTVESRTIAIRHSRKQLANSQNCVQCVFVLGFDENAHNKSCVLRAKNVIAY